MEHTQQQEEKLQVQIHIKRAEELEMQYQLLQIINYFKIMPTWLKQEVKWY